MPMTDMLDGKIHMTDLNIGAGQPGTWTHRRTSVTPGVLPKRLEYGDGVVTVLAMDTRNHHLFIRIDRQMSPTPIGFNVIVGFNTTIGAYYYSSLPNYRLVY
ncbi:hypothetical protein [Sphingorhabdus sp.]|uniref:hypothetical protein n=1 Tax=Sphingorhabdus sp. TaxID=1902408 RepID=UPI0032B833FE